MDAADRQTRTVKEISLVVVSGLLASRKSQPSLIYCPTRRDGAICKCHCGRCFENPKSGFILGPAIRRNLRGSDSSSALRQPAPRCGMRNRLARPPHFHATTDEAQSTSVGAQAERSMSATPPNAEDDQTVGQRRLALAGVMAASGCSAGQPVEAGADIATILAQARSRSVGCAIPHPHKTSQNRKQLTI